MPHRDDMLGNYYARMGWDERGVPRKETLERLGISHVWAGLRRL
jgi:aldehyde:ferredoxin oxidoreductase